MPKRLSKAELHYLISNPEGLTAEELSKELGYGIPIIKKYMKPLSGDINNDKIVETTQTLQVLKHEDNIDIMMAKKVKEGEVISTIMTPGASQKCDDAYQKMPHRQMRKDIKNAIHKCKSIKYKDSTNEEILQKEIKKLQDKVSYLELQNAK